MTEPYSDHHRAAFRRVKDANDPYRCVGKTAFGQCNFVAMPGSHLCAMHSRTNTGASLTNYRLNKFMARARAGEMANSSRISELRDEIGIARVLLEERLEMIETTNDLLIHGQSVERLLDKIKDLITTFNTIQQKAGMFLDKNQAQELAAAIITIISAHIQDPDTLVNVANEISDLFDSPA